jgi:hypothetical protein
LKMTNTRMDDIAIYSPAEEWKVACVCVRPIIAEAKLKFSIQLPSQLT